MTMIKFEPSSCGCMPRVLLPNYRDILQWRSRIHASGTLWCESLHGMLTVILLTFCVCIEASSYMKKTHNVLWHGGGGVNLIHKPNTCITLGVHLWVNSVGNFREVFFKHSWLSMITYSYASALLVVPSPAPLGSTSLISTRMKMVSSCVYWSDSTIGIGMNWSNPLDGLYSLCGFP